MIITRACWDAECIKRSRFSEEPLQHGRSSLLAFADAAEWAPCIDSKWETRPVIDSTQGNDHCMMPLLRASTFCLYVHNHPYFIALCLHHPLWVSKDYGDYVDFMQYCPVSDCHWKWSLPKWQEGFLQRVYAIVEL